jgi:tRNA uridine 5-carboxymethylaminomethyl modification enzyme
MLMEDKRIPTELDYSRIAAISRESREKLEKVRPKSLGQASRIPGVTPADIAILNVYLEQMRRKREPSEPLETL